MNDIATMARINQLLREPGAAAPFGIARRFPAFLVTGSSLVSSDMKVIISHLTIAVNIRINFDHSNKP
ncbi:MAG: hypothetical protein II649_00240 [Kiritimatiellae bacterium]|nr:hypothetical protein [Kiritimatiellia bacterium]